MRIWGVPVGCMCQKHLLGEHVEMHMFKATIESGKSVDGYVRDKLLDTNRIAERHELLVEEMRARGIRHNSPLDKVDYPEGFVHRHSVVQDESEMELARRCPDCRALLEKRYGAERFQHLPVGGDGIESLGPGAGFVAKYNGQIIRESANLKRDKVVTYLERYRRKMRA